jgi:hypothetical protein
VVIASLVGLLAILVSGYTAYLQRKQVQAQVWPRVELARNGLKGSIMASSNGIGPARVKAVRITVDGKAVRHWTEFASGSVTRGDGPIADQRTSDAAGYGDRHRGGATAERKTSWSGTSPTSCGRTSPNTGLASHLLLLGAGTVLAGRYRPVGGLQIDEDEEVDDCPIKDKEKFQQ